MPRYDIRFSADATPAQKENMRNLFRREFSGGVLTTPGESLDPQQGISLELHDEHYMNSRTAELQQIHELLRDVAFLDPSPIEFTLLDEIENEIESLPVRRELRDSGFWGEDTPEPPPAAPEPPRPKFMTPGHTTQKGQAAPLSKMAPTDTVDNSAEIKATAEQIKKKGGITNN